MVFEVLIVVTITPRLNVEKRSWQALHSGPFWCWEAVEMRRNQKRKLKRHGRWGRGEPRKTCVSARWRAFHGGGGELFSWIKAPSQLNPRVLVFSQPQFPSEPWTQVNTQGLEKPHTLLFLAFIGGRWGNGEVCAHYYWLCNLSPLMSFFFFGCSMGLVGS